MKKPLKWVLGCLAGLLALLVAALLFVGLPSFTFTQSGFTQNDYRNIMGQSITGNPRVVDVAMLGAHDAFSHEIDKSSPVDPQEGDDFIVRNGFLRAIGGGLFARFAKAQKSGAYDLAARGVRYFDVRITRYEGQWYTTHGMLSAPLESYLLDLLAFLAEVEGEFIVFDMQHAWVEGASMEELFAYIESVQLQGKSLFSYVRMDPATQPLAQLRYADATAGGAGVVVLAKTPQYPGCPHYEYEGSMRSVWHNKNDRASMLAGIAAEYNTLKENPELDRGGFRKNQVQMTGKYTPSTVLRTFLGWSLLDMAEDFNAELLDQPDFMNWFEVLPIFMTDYADSMKGDFNDRVIAAINQFNAGLA